MSDPQLWIGVLALLITAYSAYFQRKQYLLSLASPKKRGAAIQKVWWQAPSLIATSLLAIMAWVPFGLDHLNRAPTPTVGISGWGTQDPINGLPIGVALIKDDPSIRIMGVAFHYDGIVDVLDVNQLQKSALYDARVGGITVIIRPDQLFLSDAATRKHVRTNYILLSVPAALREPSFSTLRQAYAMGAKSLWNGTGPP